MKINFKVFDKNGMDVTNDRCWYLDSNGDLCYETTDIDFPVMNALEEEGFRYELNII